MELFGLLTTWPLFFTFIICTIVTLRSYLRTKNKTSLLFMLSFLFFGTTYLIWGLRVALIDANAPAQEFYWFWILVYFFGGLALIFQDFATVQFLKSEKRAKLVNFLIILIALSFAGVVYFLFFNQFDTKLVVLSDVTDLDIDNIIIKGYLFLSMGIYILIPNAIFIYFIKVADSGFVRKKVCMIEIGVLLTCIGMGLDGVRIADNFGMILIRWLVMIGGLIIIAGLVYRKKD